MHSKLQGQLGYQDHMLWLSVLLLSICFSLHSLLLTYEQFLLTIYDIIYYTTKYYRKIK